jgi:hypothetical protein
MMLNAEGPNKSLWSYSETWGRFALIPFLAAHITRAFRAFRARAHSSPS